MDGFVPLSIRTQSHVVSWLWRRSPWPGWLSYERARWLARWLP